MRIAVVGLGFMGLTHLKAYKRIPGVEIGAVSSNIPSVLAGDLSSIQGNLDIAGEAVDFSSAEKFADAAECVRKADVDAVDLCLPTSMHAPVATEALRAGKHVLVEKPMALSGPECDGLIEEARKAGKVLMSAQVLRFFPAYLPLIEACAGGKLGRPRHALFRRRCAAPTWGAWLTSKAASGGGVFDLLIHDIDMALVCFGAPESVSATGHEDLTGGIDLMTAGLHYASGLNVTISGGWHLPSSYPFSMEYTAVGEDAAIEYSSAGRPPHWYGRGEDHVIELADTDGYQAEIEYFVHCCRTGAPPERCSPESSAAAVRLARLLDEARARKGEMLPCQL
ncbi:MAG: Gfo/Idh/MocA family oxidoreductase [Candidatus Solibacter usitatus]|nr:Gfo/Idh/MocA family oxidoreductase [Candidatus Solibacter usitatus]